MPDIKISCQKFCAAIRLARRWGRVCFTTDQVRQTVMVHAHHVGTTDSHFAQYLDAEIDGSGSVMLPHTPVLDLPFAGSLKLHFNSDGDMQDTYLDCSIDDFSLKLNCPVSEKDSIPLPSLLNVGASDTLTAEAWLKAQRMVERCMGRNNTRPNLVGLGYDASRQQLCATDGHRLALAPLALTIGDFKLSRLTIENLAACLQAPQLYIERYNTGDSYTKLTCGNIEIIDREYTLPFPDFKRAMPKTASATGTVERLAVLKTCKLLSSFAHHKTQGASFALKDQQILFSVKHEDTAVSTALPILNRQGDQHVGHIGFNLRYMLQAMQACPDKFVNLAVQDDLSPILLTGNDSQGTWVVMPMRI